MICPLCHNEIKDGSTFCGRCGKKIPRCPTCGVLLEKPVKFCPKDGTRISEDILAVFPMDLNAEKPKERQDSPERRERKFCIKCGRPCLPGEKYCETCSPLKTAFCVKCGEPCLASELLCKRCQRKKKLHLAVWFTAVLLLLIVCAGGYYYFAVRSGNADPAEESTQVSTPAPEPFSAAVPTPSPAAASTPTPRPVLTPNPTVEPTPVPTPAPTPVSTPAPTLAPTPEPTPVPEPAPNVSLEELMPINTSPNGGFFSYEKNDQYDYYYEGTTSFQLRDNMGNTYDRAFGGAIPSTDNWQDFELDGNYTSISGTVFLNYRNRNDYGSLVKLSIYCLDADGREIRDHYDSGIIECGVMPKHFEYDISGAKYIRIIIFGDEYLRLADCKLTRAVSSASPALTNAVSKNAATLPLVQVITSGDFTVGLRENGTVLYAGAEGPEKEAAQWDHISRIWYDPQFGLVGINEDGRCLSPGRELEEIDGITALAFSTVDYKDTGRGWKEELWNKGRLFGLRKDGTVHLLSKLDDSEKIFDKEYESWRDVSAIAGARGVGIHGVTKSGKILGYYGEYYTQPVQTLLCDEGAVAALTTDGRVLTNIVSLRPIVYQWSGVKKIYLRGQYGEGGSILALMDNGNMNGISRPCSSAT